MHSQLIFHQLLEANTSTYTYILADVTTRDAIIIDPVLETVPRDLALISELNLKLLYALDTHIHADHITGAGKLRQATGCKTAISSKAQVTCADVALTDGQELCFGSWVLSAISTPGHTASCMTFYCANMLFTGDSLMIRSAGRTDFQEGSAASLYDSITKKLFTLPDNTRVYPGHNYQGLDYSTIGEEKIFNSRIGNNKTKEEFIKIMSNLKLDPPKKIDEALPANLACGSKAAAPLLVPDMSSGIPLVNPKDLQDYQDKITIVDVRSLDEFYGELGHISGAKLFTLGESLISYLGGEDKNKEIVFVCRSGGRSGQATSISMEMGFKNPRNMVGGMMLWNKLQLPVEFD